MRRLYTPDEFALLNEPQQRDAQTSVAIASVSEPQINESGRTIDYLFSTPAVGRDLHTVAADAWRLDNYRQNPVFLWAHDDQQPPVGRVIQIANARGALKGTVEYAERDISPFADMIYQMVRRKYLNAVSTSWQPLKWTRSTDKARPGGLDFTDVDLLEISQVPIPAMPQALAEARACGIDTTPMRSWAERLLDMSGLAVLPRGELEVLRRAATMPVRRDSKSTNWKVGAARNMPVEDSDEWDGAAAEESIFDHAGGEDFDPDVARKGFLVYDAANAKKRGSYKLPIAHVVNGEFKVPKGAIRAAASRLPDTDIPDGVRERAEAVLEHYKKEAGIGAEGADDDTKEERAVRAKHARALSRAPKLPAFRRGLCEVAGLAYLLHSLGYCHSAAEYETALEGDESEVPAMIGEALKAAGEALIAMTEEEVAELLEATSGDQDEDLALPDTERAFIAAGKTVRSRAWRRGIAMMRAGRTLSASNQGRLEEAQTQHERAMKQHQAASESHEETSGHIEKVRDVHKRTTSTLAELGYDNARVTRCMSELGDGLDSLTDSHEDVGDAHRSMGRSVERASRCVRAVLNQSTPTDDEDKDDDNQGGTETRAARARRAAAIKASGTT